MKIKVAVIAVVMSVLVSCQGIYDLNNEKELTKDKLIGYWRTTLIGSITYMQFSESGEFVIQTNYDDTTAVKKIGIFTVSSRKEIQLTYDDKTTGILQGNIDGGILTVTTEGLQIPVAYARINAGEANIQTWFITYINDSDFDIIVSPASDHDQKWPEFTIKSKTTIVKKWWQNLSIWSTYFPYDKVIKDTTILYTVKYVNKIL